jgi:hypothetical protein
LIITPMTDAEAPPTADGQEVATGAQPDSVGGGSSATDHQQQSHMTPLSTELPEAVKAHTPARDKEAPEKPAPRPPPARRLRAVLAAALAMALVIIGLGIVVLEREAVIAAASRLTNLVGLEEPPGAGLDIGAVTSFREEALGGDVLVVQGTVTNLTDEVRSLPAIRVSLFNTDDTELQHVMVVPDQEVIASGESIAFSARLEQPAPTARRIKVTFAARSAST